MSSTPLVLFLCAVMLMMVLLSAGMSTAFLILEIIVLWVRAMSMYAGLMKRKISVFGIAVVLWAIMMIMCVAVASVFMMAPRHQVTGTSRWQSASLAGMEAASSVRTIFVSLLIMAVTAMDMAISIFGLAIVLVRMV